MISQFFFFFANILSFDNIFVDIIKKKNFNEVEVNVHSI